MYLVLKGVMEHMKISALFNNNKTAHQLREIWKYASLVGINNQEIEVPLENDIGASGEIYEGGKVRVCFQDDGGIEIALCSKGTGKYQSVMVPHPEAFSKIYLDFKGSVIGKCFIQPCEGDGKCGRIESIGDTNVGCLYFNDSDYYNTFSIPKIGAKKCCVSARNGAIHGIIRLLYVFDEIEIDDSVEWVVAIENCVMYSPYLEEALSKYKMHSKNGFYINSSETMCSITNVWDARVVRIPRSKLLTDREMINKIFKALILEALNKFNENNKIVWFNGERLNREWGWVE